MSNVKYIESNIPPHLKAHVVYLYPGRVSKNQLKKIGRTNTKYVTLCRLKNRETNETVAEGRSACSVLDNPNRATGRAIAVGRALAQYAHQYNMGVK